MLLTDELLKESEIRFSELDEPNPSNLNKTLQSLPGIEMLSASPEKLAQNINRKMTLEYKAPEPTDFAYERAIGKNDSVYSNFVELLMDAKEKVGRILVKNENNLVGYATGFMVSPRLMLTNWHVFQNPGDAAHSEVQFGYELDVFGKEKPATAFSFCPDEFFYSNQNLDYCFVAVNPTSRDSSLELSKISYLYLDPQKGKLGEENKESLNIIHHPDGDFKQLSIRENLFTKITPTTIWYKADTAQGSSGGPVFNDQWQVVALHHLGIADKNDKGEYIDKYGNPVPYIGGRIQESKVNWIANEGIRTSAILEDIFSAFPNDKFIAALKLKNNTTRATTPLIKKPEIENISINDISKDKSMETSNGDIQITLSSSMLNDGTNFNLNISKTAQTISHSAADHQNNKENNSLFEIKKLEELMDYSLCKGYVSNFLGKDIALPEPGSKLKKFLVVPLQNKTSELKYHHYSVRHHSIRKMPIISAINVDGDLTKRLDEYDRKDNWLRDNRIDFTLQLDDTFYRNSGFDRGHMSRREDADWGKDADEAKRNADLTCMHTNACPQVAALNQSSKKGLWGKLELTVLESGALIEGKSTNKISVFNGPIFRENDPVFRGVQIPMDFYKIILWPKDNGVVQATAFVLSQSKLVHDISFEQLDIHKNKDFKLYQYSIAKLAKETGLDFSKILPMDTFAEKMLDKDISSENEVAALFK